MSTLAQIIGPSMNDESASEDALGSDQFNLPIRDRTLGIALAISLEVS